MSSLGKALILIAIVLLAGIGLVIWKAKVGGHESAGLTKLTKEDMEMIFKDAPPQALKRLAEDPAIKKQAIESVQKFLALAEEARRTGYADKPENKEMLENIRDQIIAVSYDREKNKDKEQMPPFSMISKEETDAYFQKAGNAQTFDEFIKKQIEGAKKDGRIPENFEVPAEQLEQAKEQYAKVQIYADEAEKNWSTLPEQFKRETELQVKLQQAQFLAQQYSSEELAKKVTATDAEVDQYLAAHPEEGKILAEKKAKAEEILKRAKAGEDFAKLAEENTEDPGSKKDGGLYKEVGKGDMVPEFENTALGLQPGQVADSVVESKFGYHIIKLERKGMSKGADGQEKETYDARHILLTTTFGDPTNPMSQPVPLKDKIKAEIEKEKEKKLTDEILARNPIEVAQDFQITVPPMPAQPEGMPPGMNLDPKQMEELQKQLKAAQESQGAGKTPVEKPALKKPEPKK